MTKLPPFKHVARSPIAMLRLLGVGAVAVLAGVVTPAAVRADADGGADAAPDATSVDSGTPKDASTSSGGQDSGTPPKADAAVSVVDSGGADGGDTRYIDGSTVDSCSVHAPAPLSAPLALVVAAFGVIALRRRTRSSKRFVKTLFKRK